MKTHIAALVLWLLPHVAASCAVVFEEGLPERWRTDFKESPAALEVLVRSVEDLHRSEWPLTRAHVEVVRTWKSDGRPLDVIESGRGGGDCGVGFVAGHRYIVFAGRTTSFWSFLPWVSEPLNAWAYGTIYLGPGREGKTTDSIFDIDSLIKLLHSLAKQEEPPNQALNTDSLGQRTFRASPKSAG